MNTEEELVLNVWDIFKDGIPAKQRKDKAYSLIRYFVEAEIITDVEALEGEDEVIDEVIEMFKDDEGDY